MSEELQAYAGGNLPDRKQIVKWFALLPSQIRPTAMKFWGCRRHIANMESPASLITNLQVWIKDFGLHPDDANLILMRMLVPGQMANHQFASQLMSALDAEVAKVLKLRKEEQYQADLAAEAAERSKTKGSK